MTVHWQKLHRNINYLPATGQRVVRRAFDRAIELHKGQIRGTGEPYVTHPIAVTNYLAQLNADDETLAAALLHDVIEDDRISHDEFEHEFGSSVTALVDGVTKLTKLHYEGRGTERQVDSLRKLLFAGSQDLRVIFIKLADRWHNIETIQGLRPDKKIRVANETLDIYVPFARLVGLNDLKDRFEEVCFPLARPEEYMLWSKVIDDARKRLQSEREAFINRIDIETAHHVYPELRKMTDYEIFSKFQGNIHRVSESQHIDSLVLIVDRKDSGSCYETLGQIHLRYPVRTLSFRDYIGAPQPNGYRALHTTIFISRNHQLLVRIQTREMYEYMARRKIIPSELSSDTHLISALATLTNTKSTHEQFLTDLRTTILTDRINVFTTAGELMILPKDATGIDFAYALSPDHIRFLGGVNVNGEARESTVQLHEGDTVELILLEKSHPGVRVEWLQKVKSVEARDSILNELKSDPSERKYKTGKSLIEFECRKRALPVWWLFFADRIQKILVIQLKKNSFQELVEAVGSGDLPVDLVINAYKGTLILSPTYFQKFLQLLYLLPRIHLLNKEADIVVVEVFAKDRKGLIYDISKCIAERDINIAQFGVYAVPPEDSLYKITLEFEKFQEFSDLYDSLLEIPNVKRVLRI